MHISVLIQSSQMAWKMLFTSDAIVHVLPVSVISILNTTP